VWFVNPLVSVLPRLAIGPVAWLVYRTVKGLGEPPAVIAAGIGGSLTNTALVLAVLGFMGFLPWPVIGTIAAANGLPEAAIAAVLTFAVVGSWKGIKRKRQGSSV
jgi:uncharacterized membrane protein